MEIDEVIRHVRQACDESHESQSGSGITARVHRGALQALLADWERLDAEHRIREKTRDD